MFHLARGPLEIGYSLLMFAALPILARSTHHTRRKVIVPSDMATNGEAMPSSQLLDGGVSQRASITSIEELLCVTEMQRRKSEATKRQLEVQLDSLVSDNALLRHQLQQQCEAFDDERRMLEDRYEQALVERREMAEVVETLESDVASMKKSLSYFSNVNAAGGDAESSGHDDPQHLPSSRKDSAAADEEEDDSKEIVLRQPLGYMNVEKIHGTSSQRQTQLLAIVEHSAVVFSAIQRKLSSLQAVIDAHDAEKKKWEANHSDLTASIAILHREKDILIHEQTRAAVDNALVVQILLKDEKLHRSLVQAQAEAALFSMAYFRAKADPMVAVKKIHSALDATVAEMNTERRMHQLDLRRVQEASAADASRLLEQAQEQHSAEVYALRKKMTDLELQNDLLRGTCDEWRQQADSRDAAASNRYEELASEFHQYRHAKELELRQQLETSNHLAAELKLLTKRRENIASLFSETGTQVEVGPDYELEIAHLKRRHHDEVSAMSHATGAKINQLSSSNEALQSELGALREELTRLEMVVVAVEVEKKSLVMRQQMDISTIQYENENLKLRSAAAERQRDFLANEAKQMHQQLTAAQAERDAVLVPSLEKLADELRTQSVSISELESRHFAAISQLSDEIRRNATNESLIANLEDQVTAIATDGAQAIEVIKAKLGDEQLALRKQADEHALQRLSMEEEMGRKEVLRGYDLYLAQRGSMPRR